MVGHHSMDQWSEEQSGYYEETDASSSKTIESVDYDDSSVLSWEQEFESMVDNLILTIPPFYKATAKHRKQSTKFAWSSEDTFFLFFQ